MRKMTSMYIIALCVIFLVSFGKVQGEEPDKPLFGLGEVALAGAAGMWTASIDVPLSQALRMPTESLSYKLASSISDAGGPVGHALVLTGLYVADRKLAAQAFQSVALAEVVTYAGKILLGRKRPYVTEGAGEYTGLCWEEECFSMPSGHTAAAFALASVLAANKNERAWVYYAGASLIGLSRIVQGKHWPSDVLAGAVIGIGAGRVGVHISRNW